MKNETGSGERKPRLLKRLTNEVTPLNNGVISNDWEITNGGPIHKKGPKCNSENYRSISVICICCKLLDHLIVSSILAHVK